MDERKEIVISIIGGNPFEEGKPYESPQSEIDNPATYINKMLHFIKNPVQTLEKKIMQSKAWPAAMLLSNATQLVMTSANIELNRYFTLKDDYIGQNTVNVIKQELSTISGIANGALAGAISGVKIGLAGVIGGAVIGGVSSGFKAYINRIQQEEQYNMQLNTINMQVSYGERRASLVNGGRGTEN